MGRNFACTFRTERMLLQRRRTLKSKDTVVDTRSFLDVYGKTYPAQLTLMVDSCFRLINVLFLLAKWDRTLLVGAKFLGEVYPALLTGRLE